MANLKSSEKQKLETYLEMRTGYVCDFVNRTFGEFVLENTGVDIYSGTYSGSKASRLRAFWDQESNHLVAKLLGEMIEYWKLQKTTPLYGYQVFNPVLYEECKKIVARLQSEGSVENVDALTANPNDNDSVLLVQSIRSSIDHNQPEQALDRLHTFVVKYLRQLCTRHAIPFDQDTPLHSLFGLYVKFLQQQKMVESEMSERILKSSISVLDAFNAVRNNKSLAHANPLLNRDESVLICSDIFSLIKFVKSIEDKLAAKKRQERERLEQEKQRARAKMSFADEEYSDEEIEAAGDAWIQSQIDIRRGK
jgi:Abortive infection C-terminus